jgi:hypothetical protein
MINNDTVFILGAGASMPYGYPSGNDLRKMIVKNFSNLCGRISNNERFGPPLLESASEFSRVFNFSSTQSIDLFLSRNPKFSEIGKLAIILCILHYEERSKFREEAPINDQDWYSYLFQKMTLENKEADGWKDFKNNKVSFITFNYDRSLEHFLHESLSNSFANASQDQISDQINNLSIHHVYGKICLLPWETRVNKEIIPYLATGDDTSEYYFSRRVYKLIPNIKVINERSKVNTERLIQCIKKAKKVFILGFGFAPENIDILKLDSVLSQNHRIFGTSMGFLESEIHRVRAELQKNFKVKDPDLHNPVIEDTDSLTLLRNYL